MKSQYIKCRFLKPTDITIIIKHTSSEIEFIKCNWYSLSGTVSIFLLHYIKSHYYIKKVYKHS